MKWRRIFLGIRTIGDRRSIGTRGTDRCLGGRPIQEEGRFAANEVGFRVSGFFVVDECAIRGGSRATELEKHASARERTHRTRRTPHPQSNSRNTEKHV